MEKNQHNSNETSGQHNDSGFTGNQAGQQPPAGNSQLEENEMNVADKKEQHSESSFPRQEGETLGTP